MGRGAVCRGTAKGVKTMDLMKTLLVYMMLVVGSATETVPAVTPPPAQPAAQS